jgi:serine/threonine protein kinase
VTAAAPEIVGGRYEIIRTLGQGAFGHTFLARDRRADREVAIKVLDTRGRTDPKAYELFSREAEVLGAVRHHGIPQVFETFQDMWYGAPSAFLAMEYVEGSSLAQLIDEKRPLDGSEVVHVFLELLGILDYLHSRVPPILHRDIKPSNIILRPNGFPALVDFGSVRRVFLSPEESGSTIAGTYGYMPYEQYMGQASPASDLFATGATFLHLLTGRAPREFMNDEGRIQVPDALPAEPRLRAVIARLLRPSPAERFASARDVRNALVGPPASAVAERQHGAVATSGGQYAVAAMEEVLALPPAPRPLTGQTKALMKSATPSTLRLLYASEKPTAAEDFGLFDVGSLVFFSVITAGILPLVYVSMANSRRRRMRRFFKEGIPGVAEVSRTEVERLPFDEKITRVWYQFEADSGMRRDSDTILPSIASKWKEGDRIPILYMPHRDYDSVIVAVE